MADAVFSGSMTGKLFLDLREDVRFEIQTKLTGIPFYALTTRVLSDFIDLTQVRNFTVNAQYIFTFRRLSVFTVSFTGILQLLMQIIKRFVAAY